jgi:hypothetical protein
MTHQPNAHRTFDGEKAIQNGCFMVNLSGNSLLFGIHRGIYNAKADSMFKIWGG